MAAFAARHVEEDEKADDGNEEHAAGHGSHDKDKKVLFLTLAAAMRGHKDLEVTTLSFPSLGALALVRSFIVTVLHADAFVHTRRHIFAGVFYMASLPTETLSRARAKTSEGSESVVAATSMLAGVGQTLVDVLGTRVP